MVLRSFVIKNLEVSVENKTILTNVSLTINKGETHVIMGPNGAGKSTLTMSVLGHPDYKIGSKSVLKFNSKNVLLLNPEERAHLGIFVSFQSPVSISGVSLLAFLRTAHKALYPKKKIPLKIFKQELEKALHLVGLSKEFMHRSLNEGFSGGEKKRIEIVQMIILKPSFVILDEIDSGLDIDSLKIIARVVNDLVHKNKIGLLIITHYQRILYYLRPDFVHILKDGIIKKSGSINLVKEIEESGYATI